MRLVNSLLPAWTISWNWKFLFVHGSTGFTPWWRLREAWNRSTAISRVFHQSGPIISHMLQSGLYFTVICLDSKGFHLSVLEGTYCFMRKRKAVKRVLPKRTRLKPKPKMVWAKKFPVNECNSCVDLISWCRWHDSVRGSRSVGRAREGARIPPTNKRARESLCLFLGILQPAGLTRSCCPSSAFVLDFPIWIENRDSS